MEIRVHIPMSAIGTAPIRTGWLTPTRLLFLRQAKQAEQIGVWLRTPAQLRRLLGTFGRERQLTLVGGAILRVLAGNAPRFHYSVVQDRFCHTSGTTILCTGRDKSDRNTLLATWDLGEHPLRMLRRLADARRLLTLPVEVAAEFLYRPAPSLAPPQVLVSCTVGGPEERPDMSLMGGCNYHCPIAVAIGTEYLHCVFDHRVYDYSDERVFGESLLKELAA
jgi:hypothetical protein